VCLDGLGETDYAWLGYRARIGERPERGSGPEVSRPTFAVITGYGVLDWDTSVGLAIFVSTDAGISYTSLPSALIRFTNRFVDGLRRPSTFSSVTAKL
jgi:hypothetical protein